MFKDIFKQLIQIKGITAYQLAKDTGLSDSLISNWKSGRQLPKYDSLNILADYFNVSGDYLLGRTDNFEIIQSFIQDKKSDNIIPLHTKTIIIPFYRSSSSAGTGNYLSDDIPIEYINVPKTETTASADFMLEVSGDSMQPKFFDGDCVLVKQSDSIYEGEIGIFIVNNESYIKKMGRGELISLNPAYTPIQLHEYDDIRCAGKVIDTIILE